MVEMLGVLAIIGVLSVGAMSGYSKAMMKYRLNKQAEQLNTVFNAVARYHGSFSKSTAQGLNLTPVFIKMGEIPSEMIKDNSDGRIADMLVKGMTMGIVDITKRLDNLGEESDKEVRKLAEKLKEYEQSEIKVLKAYL